MRVKFGVGEELLHHTLRYYAYAEAFLRGLVSVFPEDRRSCRLSIVLRGMSAVGGLEVRPFEIDPGKAQCRVHPA